MDLIYQWDIARALHRTLLSMQVKVQLSILALIQYGLMNSHSPFPMPTKQHFLSLFHTHCLRGQCWSDWFSHLKQLHIAGGVISF